VLNLKIGPDCGKNSTHDLLSSAQSNYSSALMLIHSHQTTAPSKYHSVNLNLVVGIGFVYYWNGGRGNSSNHLCTWYALYIIADGCWAVHASLCHFFENQQPMLKFLFYFSDQIIFINSFWWMRRRNNNHVILRVFMLLWSQNNLNSWWRLIIYHNYCLIC
jgi:hypothetical protein